MREETEDKKHCDFDHLWLMGIVDRQYLFMATFYVADKNTKPTKNCSPSHNERLSYVSSTSKPLSRSATGPHLGQIGEANDTCLQTSTRLRNLMNFYALSISVTLSFLAHLKIRIWAGNKTQKCAKQTESVDTYQFMLCYKTQPVHSRGFELQNAHGSAFQTPNVTLHYVKKVLKTRMNRQ